MGTLIICILICAGLLFFSKATEKKNIKAHNDAVAALTKGSRILTVGGMKGTVEEVTEQSIKADMSPDGTGSVIEFSKDAFMRTLG